MSSQSFEYNLVLRIQQAEAQVEQFANRMASLLTEASNRSATAIRNQAEEAARSSENAARRSGEARVEEENRVAQIILVTQDRTASQIERTWTAMYNRIAEQARVTLGGNASNADWFRSQDRLAEINRLGEAFRREFSAEHFEPMIQALERRLRGVSGSLNRLNDPQEEYRRWTQARGETIANFTREAQEIQRVSEIANAAHDRRVAMNKQDEAGIVRRAELEEQENLSNIRALELEDQKTAEAANRAIQDILRRAEQSHALHQGELDYLAQEFAAITRNSAAEQEAANNWATVTGKRGRDLLAEDASKAVKYPEVDLIQRIAQLKLEDLAKDLEATKKKEKADQDAIRAKREEESKAHKARLADIAEYESRTEDGQRRIIGEQIQADADAVRRKERLHNAVTAFQKAGLLSTEKQKDSNDKLYDRIYRGIKTAEEADAIRYARILRLDAAFRSAHAQNEADLLKLMSRRDDMSEQMFANELRRIQAIAKARLDAAKTSGWDAHNQDLSAFAGGGRTVSNMFQIQQAFEDFQYAGLRGAANNIAMMAANLGGTAGVVALMGIMGLQASHSLGVWEKINDAANGFLWTLKSVTEEQKLQNGLAETNFEIRDASFEKILGYEGNNRKAYEKELVALDQKVKYNDRMLAQSGRALDAYRAMEEAAKALDLSMPTGWLGPFQSSPEEAIANIDKYRAKLKAHREKFPATNQLDIGGEADLAQLEFAQKEWEKTAQGAAITADGFELVDAKANEYRSTVLKLIDEQKVLTELLNGMRGSDKLLSRMGSAEYLNQPGFSSEGLQGEAKASFEKDIQQRQSLVELAKQEAIEKARMYAVSRSAALDEARTLGNKEKERDIYRDIAEYTRQALNDVREAENYQSRIGASRKEEYKALSDMEVRNTELKKNAIEEHKAELSEIEKKLSATQSLIKADEERVRVLELQKSAFEDQAGKQGVDLTVKQLQHEAELEKDAYKESAKRGKEAFLAEVERIRELARQKLEYQKRHNARGRGDSNPDVALQEQYNREKAAFDEWVTWQVKRNEEADAHNLKRIERQAELDAKAKFKEYDTAQRDKLNQLKDQADKYTSEGKLVEAGEVRKQIDKTLKDLSAAQAKMIGQGTKAEGRAARDEWEKLNAQIIENMTKEQELYKQRKAMNEEIAAEQASAVDFIKDRLEEISAIKPFDQSAMGELGGWLQQLNAIKGRMEEIVALSAAINGPNSGASSKPSGKAGLVGGGVGFAVGTDYVPETGLALIHKGEMIIPAEEAAGIRAARNSYLTPTDDSRIRSSRLLYNKTYKDANSLYSNTSKELIDSRNSGNTFAVDELENVRRAFEEFQKTMAEVNKDLSQYEEAYKKQEADKRRMAETERHNAAMAEIKESAAREKLRREESAKRIREIEAEGKKKSEEILNRGPESTPEYIARRRGEILRRRTQIERDWAYGLGNADKIDDHKSYLESRGLNSEIRGAAHGIVDFQSRIVDEIEKTHEMVKEAKSKVENHPLELNKQREAAGDFLEDHGWRKKFLKRKDDTGRDPEGVYSSPQFLADEERRAKEAEKAAKIKRARAMSGMTPSENEKASVESAMQLEQNLERSAKQKALLEAMQAVKEAEVTGANELAAALERAAAAKEALAAAGNGGGYGSSAPGMGLSGGSAAGIGGGGGGGGGSSPNSLTINNNMTAHMAQASPNAVFAAMAAAAQISGIRRR